MNYVELLISNIFDIKTLVLFAQTSSKIAIKIDKRYNKSNIKLRESLNIIFWQSNYWLYIRLKPDLLIRCKRFII